MIYFLRAPESDGRPEKWMADSIIDALRNADVDLTVVPCQNYSQIGGANYFYGDESYAAMVQQVQSLVVLLAGAPTERHTVFFMDVWNPAIPLFLSELRLRNIPVPALYGYCHGSSGVEGDLYQNYAPARHYETYLNSVMDGVFVPTEYSKDCWGESLGESVCNVATVTGSPLKLPFVAGRQLRDDRKNTVVFAHRLVPEKGANLLPYLADKLSTLGMELKVLSPCETDYAQVPVTVCSTKTDYLNYVAESSFVISLASMETFGYSIYEGYLLGSHPIVPSTACYPNLWTASSLYGWHGLTTDSVDAAIVLIEQQMQKRCPVAFLGQSGEDSITRQLTRGIV